MGLFTHEYVCLKRLFPRKKQRKDWPERWSAAVAACHGKGVYFPKEDEPYAMVARRDSPVWKYLARGVGGFRDATGHGEPPFAYSSGLGWRVWRPGKEKRKKDNDITLDEKSRYVRKIRRKEREQKRTEERNLIKEIEKSLAKNLKFDKEIKIQFKL